MTAAAPKVQRDVKRMGGLTLPGGAHRMVDALVGTFVGATKSEVLRYMVVSWLVEHHAFVEQIALAPGVPVGSEKQKESESRIASTRVTPEPGSTAGKD